MSYISAAVAGTLSFLSPCVLALVPGYLSYISGVSIEELEAGRSRQTARVATASVLFVLGFSAVFVALGASASLIGVWLSAYRWWLAKASGVVIVAMGLFLLGWLRVPKMLEEKRFHLGTRKGTPGAAFLLGLAFGFGWTPCVGPLLASVLAVAGQSQSLRAGVALLSAYSLGLAVPLVLAALAFDRFLGFFDRVKKYLSQVTAVSGLVLVAVGLLVTSGYLPMITGWLYRFWG